MKTVLVRHKVKDRCEEPPVSVELTAVGTYRLIGA